MGRSQLKDPVRTLERALRDGSPKPKTTEAAPAKLRSTTARAAQEVRIIGGLYKRSILSVVDAPGLRPTPNRVRETLFNWLGHHFGHDLSGLRCVDAYAGTGALGLEAASRGAAHVQLLENNGR